MSQNDHLFPVQEDLYSPLPAAVFTCMSRSSELEPFKLKKKCCKKFKKGKRCGACPK